MSDEPKDVSDEKRRKLERINFTSMGDKPGVPDVLTFTVPIAELAKGFATNNREEMESIQATVLIQTYRLTNTIIKMVAQKAAEGERLIRPGVGPMPRGPISPRVH